jgi:hypothetical protein
MLYALELKWRCVSPIPQAPLLGHTPRKDNGLADFICRAWRKKGGAGGCCEFDVANRLGLMPKCFLVTSDGSAAANGSSCSACVQGLFADGMQVLSCAVYSLRGSSAQEAEFEGILLGLRLFVQTVLRMGLAVTRVQVCTAMLDSLLGF